MYWWLVVVIDFDVLVILELLTLCTGDLVMSSGLLMDFVFWWFNKTYGTHLTQLLTLIVLVIIELLTLCTGWFNFVSYWLSTVLTWVIIELLTLCTGDFRVIDFMYWWFFSSRVIDFMYCDIVIDFIILDYWV